MAFIAKWSFAAPSYLFAPKSAR